MKIRIIFLLLIIYYFPVQAQLTDSKQKIIAQYDSILTRTPREKIYAHFDKATYLPSDTIWFKAYLMNASIHTPSTISNLIYTEIINEKGEVVERLSLPTAIGLTWGSFALKQEKHKPGNYTFRAYTNWMQNFGDSHFFKKEFKILPLTDSPISSLNNRPNSAAKTNNANLSARERSLDIDVQFLPEGGNYLVIRNQKIAFKALNSSGKGIPITGEIINSSQRVVSQLVSNDKGMGYFKFSPELGETYSAKVTYNGLSKTFQLPKVTGEGTALKVENEYLSDSITITAFSSRDEQNYTIVGQARGIMCFVADLKFNANARTFKIAKNIFPTGVCQVILLNEQQKIINERNFFINHSDELKINISTPSLSYKLRDSVPLHLKVVNAAGIPLTSSLSIAVTDNHQVAKDSVNDSHILSYLLLQADLKGEIETPGYYFTQPNKQKHDDLEALMLTQGWVSYNWDILKKPIFKAEKEYTFSGKVTNALNKPISKAKIILMGNNRGFVMMDTLANEKGEFTFDKLPRMDSASFVIQAMNAKGKKGTIGIEMNEFKPPAFIVGQKKPVANTEPLDSISTNLIKTKVEAYKLTQRDGLLLNEVTIVGKRTIKGSKNLNGPGEADLIITEEDLSPIAKKTLHDVLVEKVKGFRDAMVPKTFKRMFFVNFNPLKFVIDGMEVDFFYTEDSTPDSYYNYVKGILDYYNAEDIKGIEVMDRQRFSARYKSQFMHPMDSTIYTFIEITTQTGQGPFLKKAANLYILKPTNYGDYKTFYHPKYSKENKNDKKPDFRSTIYWNPNFLTSEKGEGDFSFFTADKPGSYTVWVEGTDLQGNFGFKTMTIKIN
ncbi:carboxypeptidase-like regulatory domain-containing protein [Pedobacter insulae]|uniref:MG2 domain-containing protein n=1 Tax=Pedobacter insulae TaxID=414048 RepID=A0A1I2UG73_9SPHI|nr:carboxypeptidase-like regulatory domain-containing protein [Pedobacter insulae]SFG76125.1 hypothetical protein SAMN04489864_102145 [Pedobacter insulae]